MCWGWRSHCRLSMGFLNRLVESSIYVDQHVHPPVLSSFGCLLDAVVQMASTQCVCLGRNL